MRGRGGETLNHTLIIQSEDSKEVVRAQIGEFDPLNAALVSTTYPVQRRGATPEQARDRYAKRGPTGFLKPLATWSVLIGHRVVDVGVNARNAKRAFKRWCKFAEGSEGMASGKQVTLTKDGQIIETQKSNV